MRIVLLAIAALLSIDEDVFGLYRPLPVQIQTAVQHAFNLVFRPEPAGLAASPSSGDFAALGQ
jgi:hypothetical protein